MDEPTAVLAPQEIDELFRTLRSMAADGRSVVFISHKLGEVLAIADRITVMRRGRVTAAGPAAGGTRRRADLARLMVGRDVLEIHRADAARARRRASSRSSDVDGRERPRAAGPARRRRSTVRAGEIVGHRRRRRQRPERAGRGHHRPAAVPRAAIRIDGEDGRQPAGRPRDPARRRPRPRGPDRGRQRAEPVGRRQPDHEALPRRRRSPAAGSSTTAAARALAEELQGRVRDRRAVDRHRGPAAVRRQPPAADPRPRDRVRARA